MNVNIENVSKVLNLIKATNYKNVDMDYWLVLDKIEYFNIPKRTVRVGIDKKGSKACIRGFVWLVMGKEGLVATDETQDYDWLGMDRDEINNLSYTHDWGNFGVFGAKAEELYNRGRKKQAVVYLLSHIIKASQG
jgi:hypothetical protein